MNRGLGASFRPGALKAPVTNEPVFRTLEAMNCVYSILKNTAKQQRGSDFDQGEFVGFLDSVDTAIGPDNRVPGIDSMFEYTPLQKLFDYRIHQVDQTVVVPTQALLLAGKLQTKTYPETSVLEFVTRKWSQTELLKIFAQTRSWAVENGAQLGGFLRFFERRGEDRRKQRLVQVEVHRL